MDIWWILDLLIGLIFLIFVIILVILFVLIIAIIALLPLLKNYIRDRQQLEEREKIREQIFDLANNNLELNPEEFFKMRNKSLRRSGKALTSNNYNFPGVYILYNESKNKYYVGQGNKALNRINNHFTGKGNGDVYADYKYGDNWKIKVIALENSGFNSLNELERHTIESYDSYNNGYNKTRGNK